MALDLGTLTVTLTADAAKFNSTLSGAQGTVQKFSGKVGKNLQTVGKFALGAAVGGVAVLGAGLAVAGKKAISLGADANETASLLESSLGASTEGLNDRLRDLASTTNRSFYELQAGSSTFVAMTKAMGATDEQAADLSGNFVGMANDLGSFFNVSTDQALGDLQGALAGSSETMQKYGIDVRETTLKQMALDQGLIDSASDTIPRYARAQLIAQAVMEQGADAMGDAERTADSWQNTMRGLRGRITDAATSIGQQLIPMLTPLLNKGLELVDRVLPALLSGFEKITTVFGLFSDRMAIGMPLVENLGSLITQLALSFGMAGPEARAVGDAFVNIVTQAQELGTQIMILLDPILQAVGQFVSWKDVLIALGVAVASVVIPAIIGIITAIGPVILVFAAVIAAVALLRNAWENNWLGIRDKVQAVIAFIVPLVQGAIEGIKAWWDRNGEEILAKAGEIWNSVKTAISNAIETVREIVGRILSIIRSNWEEHGEGIKAAAAEAWTALKERVAAIVEGLKETIARIAGGIRNFWESHGEELKSLAEGVWNAIETFIDGAFENIKNLFEAFTALFRGDWEAFGDEIKEMWANTWDIITGVIGDLWDGISPLLSTLWGNVTGWFSDLAGEFASIGSNLITSLADAISSRANSYLRRVAQGVAALLPGWVKDILGISSPSREFHFIGEMIGRGLVEGILSMTDDVEAAVESLFEIAGTVSNIGGTMSTLFKARVADPLEERLKGLREGLKETIGRINDTFEDAGWEDFDFASLSRQQQIERYFKAVHDGNTQMANDIRAVWRMEEERNQTAEEFQAAQEKLIELEKQQQDLALLKAQQDLLNLIRDNNLSTSILAGLELGLDADLGDIMSAMSEAMQSLLAQAEEELGIASPSKKFAEIGMRMGEGLVQGINAIKREAQQAATSLAMPDMRHDMPALAGAGGARVLTIQVDARGAQRGVGEEVRRAVQEALRKAGINADTRRRV